MGGPYSTYAETATVAISAQNDAPSTSGTSLTIVQNISAGGRLSGSDVDGDPLTYQLVSSPTKGNLVFNQDGIFNYIPTTGQYGSDQFSYRVNDGTANSEVATVQISILKEERKVVMRTSEEAASYLQYLDEAIATVNQRFSTIGAYANRLQAHEDMLMTSLVNTEATYNRLMNADIAAEQMDATKNSILQQTSIAMLGQTINASRYILQLFQ
jgi:flagellin-like hook-associated protein FlgL